MAARVVSIAFSVLLERAVTAFRAMQPRFCSIYDPYFWWHERFWKMSGRTYHSLEDGTFKSDHITIGPGCTLGTSAFAHDGVTMQEGSVLDADAFLMKGEDVPPRARYRGNPPREAVVA